VFRVADVYGKTTKNGKGMINPKFMTTVAPGNQRTEQGKACGKRGTERAVCDWNR
jgi:hypothetical protein